MTATYDAENRIVSVDGGATATYAYDAEGRRVIQKVNGVESDDIFDLSGHVMTIMGDGCGAGCWARGYVYSGGQLVAEYGNGTTYFMSGDHLGSTRLMTGVNQSIFDSMDYLPFGEQIAGDGGTVKKFTGYPRDSESNLDYALFRHYSSRQGSFMQADPYMPSANPANPQSWNRYAYVLNSPLLLSEPTGLGMMCRSANRWPCSMQSLSSIFAFIESSEEGTFSGSCPMYTTCEVMGQTEFDAIAGAPGTYVEQGSNSSMSFGWDYGLYSATMNQIDQINGTIAASQQNAQAEGEPNPFPGGEVPNTYGWTVEVQNFDTFSVTTGVIPDMLATASYGQWLSSAVGPNPSAATLNQYSGYYEVYQNMQRQVCLEIQSSFNINLNCH